MFKGYNITYIALGFFLFLIILSVLNPVEENSHKKTNTIEISQNSKNEIETKKIKKIPIEEEFNRLQNKKKQIFQSILDISLIEVTNDKLTIKVINSSNLDIRHFDFKIILKNAFGEAVGFDKSGNGTYKYESINSTDLIKSNSTKYVDYDPRNITDFTRHFNKHENNLKASFYVEKIKFNNDKEYSATFLNYGLYNGSKEDKINTLNSLEEELSELKNIAK